MHFGSVYASSWCATAQAANRCHRTPSTLRPKMPDLLCRIEATVFRAPATRTQTPLTRRVRDTAQATHLLTIRYSPEAINQLLRSVADVDESEDTTPISAYADSALVWLLIEDGQRSLLVGGDTGRNVLERAREIGGGVNQRLTFPSMDEVDTRALVVDDLIAGRQQKILAASERYREDVVLTGILTRARGRRWSANWSRYQGQTVEDFSSDAASLDQALQQGIRWLARDSLVEPTGAGIPAGLVRRDEGLIAIGAVDSVKDYAGVMSMLGRLQGVSVSLRAVRQDAILVAVSPRSAVNDVAQRMLAENRVVSARGAQAPAGFQADVVLQYAR